DNFWEMGETGPCGPCSEIHIDLRSDKERAQVDGATLVNKDNNLVIEIWNLVFMQYNRKANGKLVALPNKHVDTGMGLERLCMAIQGKKSNYDTDVFSGMIEEISSITGKKYRESPQTEIAMRVIADHIRAISFSIADGQLPSNVKAGYVIRRILRRAVRYAYTFLNSAEPLLFKLVSKLVSEMGEAFPELVSQQNLIEKVIKEEEESFLRTLDKGIKLLDNLMGKNLNNHKISGKEAFTLYDTYGFPIDLSELIAKENGFTIDHIGFQKELQKQKERSRKATISQEGDWVEIKPYKGVEFTGYEKTEDQAQIVRYRSVKNKDKVLFQVVLDKSPFYAESGGQVGDTGVLVSPEGDVVPVINTVRESNLTIHICTKLPKNLETVLTASVNQEKRQNIANNHTATHLLHQVLREVLGNHIEQKGSLVGPSHFRFDFSHFEKISEKKLREIENLVNSYIRSNTLQTEIREVPIERAKAMGAIALFGEKYDNNVRVIKFGESVELCGGTHTSATGNIGLFKIISESAIAAGVRRIEAATGVYAEKIVEDLEDIMRSARLLLSNSPNMVGAIEKLINENEIFRKKVDDAMRERAIQLKDKVLSQKQTINGVNIYLLKGNHHSEVVKDIAFLLRNELKESVFIAAYRENKKPYLALMYTNDLVAHGYDASKDIREASKLINGGGGGQPFFATAGGKNIEGIDYAMEKLIALASKQASI
ncbi:MAG: alanine--tRNA ligase, partial [Bacteroidales bacterium]